MTASVGEVDARPDCARTAAGSFRFDARPRGWGSIPPSPCFRSRLSVVGFFAE
jgi:hypothetical protein